MLSGYRVGPGCAQPQRPPGSVWGLTTRRDLGGNGANRSSWQFVMLQGLDIRLATAQIIRHFPGKGPALLEYRDIYAGGRLVGSASPDVITIVNPASEEIVGAVPSAVSADVDHAVRAARRAFDDGHWATCDPAQRAAALERL